ncbi:hypothetical protein EJB05_42397, partial [Eragrostis curvula]
MARHQTNCPWGIELLEAAVIFAAAIAIAAVAAVGFFQGHAVDAVLCLLLGGLPSVIFFVIGVRLCLTAFRRRNADDEEEEEEEIPQGVAGHGLPRNQPRGSIRLPAIALAQLQKLQPANKAEGAYAGGGRDQECAICLGKVGDGGVATTQLPLCRHAFHTHCIEQWLRVHPTCPICRRQGRRRSSFACTPDVLLHLFVCG